jgi:hypothetical protein
MNLPALLDDGFKVDVRPALLRQPVIEGHSRLSPGFAYFIGFKSPLDNVGYRAIFTAGKPVCEIPRLCASYRKLWFGHA